MHSVNFVHTLDPLLDLFWSYEAHRYVDSADYQHSVLRFDLSCNLSSQPPVAGINLARFQRASKRADHSTGGGRNDIVQG